MRFLGSSRTGLLIGFSCTHPARLDARLIRLAVRLQGGIPVSLRPGAPVPWERLHGLVVGGGAHIHPRHFQQRPEVEARYVLARDVLEMELLEQALLRDMPVLGICRGAQALNISRAGSLMQDITPHRRLTRPRNLVLPLQPARLAPGSRLARTLGVSGLGVNRIHSQAIDQLGEAIDAVAWDADGFIQGIELRKARWVVGVQWHPEYLLYHPAHRRLFAALVRAARRYQQEHLGESG